MPSRIDGKQRLRPILDANVSSINKNGLSAHESIQRGRAALVEAEDHIQKFEEYLQSSTAGQDIEDDPGSPVLDLESDDNYWINAEEKMDTNCCLDELLDKIDPITPSLSNTETHNGTTDLVDQSIRDEEARLKREEIISSVRIHSDFALNGFSENRILQGTELDATVKPRSKRIFNPNNLSVARRAAEKGVTGDCKKEFKQFKARPLPGGREVHNNPYALTQAARGKVSQRAGADGGDASVDIFTSSRLDASALLGNDVSFSASPNNTHSNTLLQNKDKKSRISKEIYKVTTQFVAKDFEDERSSEESTSDQQSVLGLHQEIARLQAELRIRRKQCLETIYSLEDETQCNSINDIGIPALQNELDNNATGSDEASFIQSNLHGCDVEFRGNPLPANADATFNSINSDENENSRTVSLYMRQKAWLDKVERKKRESKEREEYDKVKSVTGKPNLNRAKASWPKAKEEHDGLVETAREKEAILQRDKVERKRQQHAEQIKEAEAMQTFSEEYAKSTKKGIDRQMQAEYADKLSQPTHRAKVDHSPTNLPNNANVALSHNDQAKVVRDSRKLKRQEEVVEPDKKITVSFADMDDNEFAKMIKTIQARAKRETRKTTTTFDNFAKRDVKSKEKSGHGHVSSKKKSGISFSPYTS